MPFKLFSSHKKNKSDINVTTNLSERKFEEPPDHESKSHKNRLHFFSNSKSSNHVQFSSDKEKKVKANGDSLEYKKAKSLTHLPLTREDDAHSTEPNSSDIDTHSIDSKPTGHHQAGSQNKPKRSASYGTFMDSLSRERRLLNIAQLDNYMQYLRHTEDEGNLANRLCCAQVLKMSLVRLEQRHLNSHERINVCHKSSTSHTPSTSSSDSDQKHKKVKDSSTFESSQNNGSTHITFSSGSDSDTRETERDSGSDPNCEDNCRAQHSLQNPVFTAKNGRTPVWPRDIEIF